MTLHELQALTMLYAEKKFQPSSFNIWPDINQKCKIPPGSIWGPSNNESLKVPINEIADHLVLHATAAELEGKEFEEIYAFQHPLERFND